MIGSSVGFRGDGFIELDRKLLPRGPEANEDGRDDGDSLAFFVSTDSPDGLLFWQNGEGTRLSNSVKESEDYIKLESKFLCQTKSINGSTDWYLSFSS